jgi:peptidyl-prolyl cis-trans isomerase B (cyclophilin B)
MVASLDAAPPIAARAALAIGRTKKVEGVAPLRAHVNAPDPGVRAMVVYGLGLLADPASLPDVRTASRDENSAVRYAAVDAIGRIDAALPPASLGEDVANDLLDVGARDPDPVVRGHALAQLDAFRLRPFARAVALRLQRRESDDPDPSVRWHAAWMLFRGYAKYADLAFLAHAAHDPEELVRVETLRALGHRKEAAAIAIVRPLLDDSSWRVQFEAREALRRLTLLPPTQHLRVMPPGIHLPPLSETYQVRNASPAPSATPRLAAPDPQTFALGARVLLYPEWAPSTVANFLQLTAAGYFDGNRWFRIVPDFVVQTGDRTNTGDGDAGYTIPAEENPVEQRSGIIAMGLDYDANGAVRDSAGTQFYVTLSPQLHLDRAFSVFGEIVDGFAVLAHLDERDRILSAVRLGDG